MNGLNGRFKKQVESGTCCNWCLCPNCALGSPVAHDKRTLRSIFHQAHVPFEDDMGAKQFPFTCGVCKATFHNEQVNAR